MRNSWEGHSLRNATSDDGAILFLDFAETVAQCETLESVSHAFRQEIAREGYTSSALRAWLPNGKGPASGVFFRNWPEDWAKLSDERNFADKTFIIPDARRRMAPFTWREAVAERRLSADEQEVWDTSVAWGWSNGLVVPLHGPAGYFATASISSAERGLNLAPDLRLHLHMISVCAHERCGALTNLVPDNFPCEMLSARELECLRWVAAGKTDWEIGMTLALQLLFLQVSESMGNHDSKIVGAGSID